MSVYPHGKGPDRLNPGAAEHQVTRGETCCCSYYKSKIEALELLIKDKTHNLRRLEAQRNELNTQGDEPCARQGARGRSSEQHG